MANTNVVLCCVPFGCALLAGIIVGIVALASRVVLTQKQQLLVKDPRGYWTQNGPWNGIVMTHHKKEIRDGALLQQDEYAVVKNELTGKRRTEEGPQLFFLGPHDILVEQTKKIVVRKGEYIRLRDQVEGTERVVAGPDSIVPKAMEVTPEGVQTARLLDVQTALLLRDRETGRQRLVSNAGVYIPSAYDEIIEERRLIHVLPHEAVIERDATGQLLFHTGSESFFLQPYHQLVEMNWSNFWDHSSKGADVTKVPVTKIDMRAKKMFFEYEVRTSDNVKLVLGGAIFWQVTDVRRMVNATSDPEGDVWHHARSALIEAVSDATLQVFMEGLNSIVTNAFQRQAADGFFAQRGVVMHSMEVTRFDCADPEVAQVLQEIIQETTDRINRLTAQQSENDVKAAAMAADIDLERQRTDLIRSQAENQRLQSTMQGESDGQKRARSANAFIGGLNETVPNVDNRIDLYKMHEELIGRNTDTKHLSSGSAHLFLTPRDLNLRMDMAGGTASTAEL